jgi:hypothetical protein
MGSVKNSPPISQTGHRSMTSSYASYKQVLPEKPAGKCYGQRLSLSGAGWPTWCITNCGKGVERTVSSKSLATANAAV